MHSMEDTFIVSELGFEGLLRAPRGWNRTHRHPSPRRLPGDPRIAVVYILRVPDFLLQGHGARSSSNAPARRSDRSRFGGETCWHNGSILDNERM
jgi:hypothetical protein